MRVKTRTFDSWRSRSRLRRPLRATLRHDMRHFEIIKVQKLKHDEEKNFIFPSSFFSFFNLFPSLSSPLLSFFFSLSIPRSPRRIMLCDWRRNIVADFMRSPRRSKRDWTYQVCKTACFQALSSLSLSPPLHLSSISPPPLPCSSRLMWRSFSVTLNRPILYSGWRKPW